MKLCNFAELPGASIDSQTTSSFKVSWADAPNPTDGIKQYVLTLQYPPGTAVNTVLVDAVAGASHTFEGLNAGQEYGVRVDAVLQDDTRIEVNVNDVVWTCK